MAQFESSVKYVPYSQEQVFNKLSDLSNLESVVINWLTRYKVWSSTVIL